jgi:hypothetical protein
MALLAVAAFEHASNSRDAIRNRFVFVASERAAMTQGRPWLAMPPFESGAVRATRRSSRVLTGLAK